jgi:hypothetical protein
MKKEEMDRLVQACEAAGVGWLFKDDREGRIAQLVQDIEAVQRHHEQKLSLRMQPSLLEQLEADAPSFKPLIQAFASPMTPEMRTMIYCVLKGAAVERVSYDYTAQSRSLLQVELELPSSGQRVSFQSDEVWDYEVLRHFGTAKKGGRPLIDGYWAFR